MFDLATGTRVDKLEEHIKFQNIVVDELADQVRKLRDEVAILRTMVR